MSGKHRLKALLGFCVVLLAVLVVGGLVTAWDDPAASVGTVVANVTLSTLFATVGLIVAYHQPRNAMGWFMYGVAVAYFVNADASEYSVLVYREHRGWHALGQLAVLVQPSWAPAIILMALLLLLFPDARIPLGRWRVALVGFLSVAAVWMLGAYGIALDAVATSHIRVDPGGDLFAINHPGGWFAWWGSAQDLFFTAILIALVLSVARQVIAYRQAEGERKLQLQWLMWGAVIFAVFAPLNFISWNATGWQQAVSFVAEIGLVSMPAAMGVAILKYRLFDIDRFISRTLSYTIVTGLLIGVYIGVVTLTTRALPLSSPVGVAVSTLAAAAAFTPIRVRVQRLVDRRFNRARYDAEATVLAFATGLRGAVDFERVQTDLVDVVRRVVQPNSVSVWIRRPT